jgi:hypothetical protein
LTTIEALKNHAEFKAFLHETFTALIKELVDLETQIIQTYRNNPTVPFDYYNLMLREINTKIQCKHEVYKRLTGEDLQ